MMSARVSIHEPSDLLVSGWFLVQSALLAWFGGLSSLKHYGNKALWLYGNKV